MKITSQILETLVPQNEIQQKKLHVNVHVVALLPHDTSKYTHPDLVQ